MQTTNTDARNSQLTAEAVKTLIRDLEMTRSEFASLCGVTRRQVQYWLVDGVPELQADGIRYRSYGLLCQLERAELTGKVV